MDKDAKKTDEAGKKHRQAVLFELENLAIGGRKIVFDTLKKMMAEREMELTPHVFSHYCLDGRIKDGILRMLKVENKKRFSDEKFVEDFIKEREAAFSKSTLKVDPAMTALVKRLSENGVQLGALGFMSSDTLNAIVKTAGWEDRSIQLMACPAAEKPFPTADAWLKLARSMTVKPAHCVVLTTSHISCRSALSAGMKAVVIPDAYTSFQDFGGADHVAEALNKGVVDKVIELLDTE